MNPRRVSRNGRIAYEGDVTDSDQDAPTAFCVLLEFKAAGERPHSRNNGNRRL